MEKRTAPRRAFLFGLREDGSPTCHPMVAIEADGETVFNTYRKSAKARNFLREPRAAVVLLPDWEAPPGEARVLKGALQETRAPDAADAAETDAGEKLQSVPQSVSDRVQRRVGEGKRMYFRLRPES
jgi:hypothetical protein